MARYATIETRLMPQNNPINAPLMWVFLFFSLAVSVATRQLIWLMVVLGLWSLLTNNREFKQVVGMREAALLFACLALPGIVSLISAANFDRAASAVFRFSTYILASWVLLSATLDRDDPKKIMSWIGLLLVIWAADGFLQLLTGFSTMGDPLVELGEEGTIVTGSLQLGYGATLAILSPFFLEGLRRAGGMGIGFLSLPVYAAIVMSGHQSSAVLAVVGFIGWAILTLRAEDEAGTKRQVTGFALAAIVGMMLGGYLSVVTGQVSSMTDAAPRYQSFLYQSSLWSAGWQAFTEHWFNGVGVRGFGSYLIDTQLMASESVSASWHPHLTVLEIAAETGLIGIAGYAVLLYLLIGYLRDDRRPVAIAALVALLAIFPLSSAVSLYSFFGGNLIFLTFTLLIVFNRDCPKSEQKTSASDLASTL